MRTVRSEDKQAIQAAGRPARRPDAIRRAAATFLIVLAAATILLPPAAAAIPTRPPQPPQAYTSYPSEPTYCSDWYFDGSRWEFWCYVESPEWDYWVSDNYYWQPDSQAAIIFWNCYGALSYPWWVCCGMGGACDA
jgi:hypothetical protein